MKSNANRHSIIIGTDGVVSLNVGSTLVFRCATIAGDPQHKVVNYDDYGDMLYRIDTFTVAGGTLVYIIETFTEERPQDQS